VGDYRFDLGEIVRARQNATILRGVARGALPPKDGVGDGGRFFSPNFKSGWAFRYDSAGS